MHEVTLQIPDKLPKEGLATDRQRLKILQLAPNFPRDQLGELGKIQATAVIDQLIPMVAAAQRKGDALFSVGVLGVVVLVLIGVMLLFRCLG